MARKKPLRKRASWKAQAAQIAEQTGLPPQLTRPRALQDRPPVSFRLDRGKLEALDGYAKKLRCTRNDLIEAVVDLYLAERGVDVDAMVARKTGGCDGRQATLDIFG